MNPHDPMESTGEPSEDRDELIEALFHEALELPVEERTAFLDRQCVGDPELRDELDTLLGAYKRAPDCLEQPAWGLGERVEAQLPREPEGSIGPYHLLSLLGEGGMGSVYLAQQLRPLRRRVALKLIKLGMDTREVVRRFDSERQALALLNHRNIAAVHDAGITPLGRPYFVMEYVPGQSITTWCDERNLSLEERLELFQKVCEAVQHAHQKGVIHRDLKPSNVLVTEVDGEAVPKIIDFGVAKATTTRGGRTVGTREGQMIGTPGYMSPEQAGVVAADVDTRSDVFSLGVLLNELLTGFLPYELGSTRRIDDAALRRRFAEVETIRPSLRVAMLGLRARKAAMRRGGDPRALSRQLKGNLDWVVLRALARDPAERYASASELSADITRHLDGVPVSASSPGTREYVRQLVARHKGPVVGFSCAVMLAISALVGFAMQEASRNDELSGIVEEREVALEAAVEQQQTLLAACEAARHEVGDELPFTTALIRNRSGQTLDVGVVVEILGVGDDHPDGGMVIDVVPARSGSRRPPLGPIDGAYEPAAHAEAGDAGPGPEGHAHHAAHGVPPGGYGLAVTHGPFARVRVDGSLGAIRANDPLGLASVEGLEGVAALHAGDGPLLGVALDDWTVSQKGLIRAFISPNLAPAPRAPEVDPEVLAQVVGRRFDRRQGPATWEPRPEVTDANSADAARDQLARGDESDPYDDPRAQGIVNGPAGPSAPAADAEPQPLAAVENPPGTMAGADDDPTSGFIPPPEDSGDSMPLLPQVATVAGGSPGGSHESDGAMGAAYGGGPGGIGPDADDDIPGDDVLGGNGKGGGAIGMSIGGDEGTDEDTDEGFDHAWGDIDGDGLTDLALRTDDGGMSILRNAGQGVFEDITAWSGLPAAGLDQGARWVGFRDVQGDGHLDLLAVDRDGMLHLLQGRGNGSFDDVTVSAGLAGLPPVNDALLFDSDGDDLVDVRITTYGGGLSLLLNEGRGRFQVVELRRPATPTLVLEPMTVESMQSSQIISTSGGDGDAFDGAGNESSGTNAGTRANGP